MTLSVVDDFNSAVFSDDIENILIRALVAEIELGRVGAHRRQLRHLFQFFGGEAGKGFIQQVDFINRCNRFGAHMLNLLVNYLT